MKPTFNPKGWQYLCRKNGWYLSKEASITVLKKLYDWRDLKAREMDESIHYILPNSLLKQICYNLPKTKKEFLKFCRPFNAFISANMNEILQIVNNVINSNEKENVLFDSEMEEKIETKKNKVDTDSAARNNSNEQGSLQNNISMQNENDSDIKLAKLAISKTMKARKKAWKGNNSKQNSLFFPQLPVETDLASIVCVFFVVILILLRFALFCFFFSSFCWSVEKQHD